MQAKGTATRKKVVLIIAGVVFAAIVAGVGLLLAGGGSPVPGPDPLVGDLGKTDWTLPADPDTGHRLLTSPFRSGVNVDAVAIGNEGTIAAALRSERGDASLLVWRPSHTWRAYALPGVGALSAVAIDPEGRVHAGTRKGHLVRVESDGAMTRTKEVVRSGYSVVGFAFDRASDRSAVMTAGGVLHTGRRPFSPRDLNTVDMPERARIRVMRYTTDGDLVVAGDAGAVFASTDEGWDERAIPTSGRVVALGWDGDGALLAAQSNGHVFRSAGSTWDRVGQSPRTPAGVGWMEEHGVVVVATDGALFATLGRDDFSGMPGYDAPGDLTVHDAEVRGDNVLMATPERILVWDGELWDSSAEEVTSPVGTVPSSGCDGVGPRSIGRSHMPPTVYRCGEGYGVVRGGELALVDDVEVGGQKVSAKHFVGALHDVYRRPSAWLGASLWAGGLADMKPVVERWEPAGPAWKQLAVLPDEARIEAMSAAPAGDGFRLWLVTNDGAVRTTMVAADADELGVPPAVAERQRFVDAWSESVQLPQQASVYAVGKGAAIVVHGRWLVTRVSADGEAVEPIRLWSEVDPETPVEERPQPMPTSGFRHLGDTLLAFGSGGIREVPPKGPVRAWKVEQEGLQPTGRPADRRFDAARAPDGSVYLLMQEAGLLRCEKRTCRPVPLPERASPRALTLTADGTIVLEEPGGVLAVRPPPSDG